VKTMRVRESMRCAVCERTLLLGERSFRFAPDGLEDFVDVCQLCQERAIDHGWVREGSPLGPTIGRQARRRRTLSLSGIFGNNRRPAAESIVAEPVLRRLSGDEQAMVEAAALFNASDGLRTVEGIARSLGPPQVSIVALSGSSPDIVLTLVWDLAWYQYRVNREATQPIRLTDRGTEPEEVAENFRGWNAHFEPGAGVVPDLENAD
jgi:hypothetical protein